MGWQLWEKGNKYKLWSTITDSYITEKLTRGQLMQVLEAHYVSEGKLKFIKEYYSFPCYWIIKGTGLLSNKNKEGLKKYFEWYNTIVGADDYYERVDNKYNEILKLIKEES